MADVIRAVALILAARGLVACGGASSGSTDEAISPAPPNATPVQPGPSVSDAVASAQVDPTLDSAPDLRPSLSDLPPAQPDPLDARIDARPAVDGLPTVSVGLPFRDRFAEGDLGAWTPVAGTWALCPDGAPTAYCQSAAIQSATFAGNPDWTNYDVRVVAVIVDDVIPGYVQVMFRVQSTERYWAFHVGRPYPNGIAEWELTVHSKTGYGHTNGGAFAYTKGVPFVIHFRVVGPVMSFDALNAKGGVNVFNITKNELPPSGRIGLGSKGQAVRFVSVAVTAL
jgi:hypothetical protein